MAKYYYNGVLLPKAPVVDEYPYWGIRKDGQNSRYDVFYSKTGFYYDGSAFASVGGEACPRYTLPLSGDGEWSYLDTYYVSWTHSATRNIFFVNADVPNGSATSTTIYFHATDPIPENEAKPKELQYKIYHNFYPYSGGITYAAGEQYVNYVVPVVKHSTYTVTMIEVGTRLRSVFTTVDPATITANITGCTDIVMNPSFSAGYTFGYLAQEDGWMVVYVSNAGERPKISIVTNGAGGDGAPLYDRKYLVRSGSTLYTITDGTLTALAETEITASLFQTYGVDEIPDGSLLVGLTDPEVLYWQDSTDELPNLTLTVKGTPPLPQMFTSEAMDLTHESIAGISHAAVDASEDVRFAISFDGGTTWKAFDGSAWFDTSDTVPGMLPSTMNAITAEQWAEVVVLESYMVRFWLPNVTAYVKSVVMHYINP